MGSLQVAKQLADGYFFKLILYDILYTHDFVTKDTSCAVSAYLLAEHALGNLNLALKNFDQLGHCDFVRILFDHETSLSTLF